MMEDSRHQLIAQRRLEQALIAFFVMCAVFVVVVYVTAPSVYTTSLMLSSSPADRYPFPITLFLGALLMFIAALIIGVLRRWRWLFWLLLVAFGFSVLAVPVMILQLMGRVPDSFPTWYSLCRLGVALLEVGLAIWMAQVYRRYGVWAMGRKTQKRAS